MRKAIYGALTLSLVLCLPAGSQTSSAGAASSWDILRKIILVPGLSGQEAKVADFILAALPASLKARRDERNNVWFTVGEGSPHIMFVAHEDELGYTVDKILPQGTVLLKPYTAFLPQVSEARAFVIHTAKGPVEGIIQPASDYYLAQTPAAKPVPAGQGGAAAGGTGFEVYIGVSTEEEARALGVAEGNPVLVKKKLVDLSPDVMATRAVDDRAGCAALLAVALQTDWSKFRGKTVTFAWDVEEETGLYGAQFMARTFKPDYMFAIDTFVSSDTPLENKRFGDAVLGQGAVLRSIDTSNVTPKTQIAKAAKLAAARGIPIQICNSRGGNDGSVYVAGGAVDIPLSWPGVHAHSFIEKIDRRDLDALTKLVAAIVEEWR